MKNSWIFPMLFALFNWVDIHSQESSIWRHNVVIESELTIPFATLRDEIAIRQNPMSDSWSTRNDAGTVTLSSIGAMLGARWKIFHTSSNVALSMGIRSRFLYNHISGNSGGSSGYFFLRYQQENDITKFARIKSISETVVTLSIPFEIQYIFLHIDIFDAFVGLGAEAGYAVSKDLEIDFRDSQMNQYNSSVLNSIDRNTSDFVGMTYGSLGFMMGESRKLLFELSVPGILMSSNYFKLAKISNYTGLKASLQIPLTKSQQP